MKNCPALCELLAGVAHEFEQSIVYRFWALTPKCSKGKVKDPVLEKALTGLPRLLIEAQIVKTFFWQWRRKTACQKSRPVAKTKLATIAFGSPRAMTGVQNVSKSPSILIRIFHRFQEDPESKLIQVFTNLDCGSRTTPSCRPVVSVGI